LDAHRRGSHPRAEGSRMTPKAHNIVDQLRQAIERSGETQYAIAKGAAVDQSVLNRFVNGERGISFETAAKLCEYLGLVLSKPRL
jgi:plasmid maintenance system antidote protein VapI